VTVEPVWTREVTLSSSLTIGLLKIPTEHHSRGNVATWHS